MAAAYGRTYLKHPRLNWGQIKRIKFDKQIQKKILHPILFKIHELHYTQLHVKLHPKSP